MTVKEIKINDDFVYNNEEEAEMGQLHAIHNNMNAIANVRRQLEQQASKPSLTHCEECGDEIPEARRSAIRGVKLCVFCQELLERTKGR
jgi:phage/conjugal plasmid C-4 type zinc finger TraR family protein